MAQNIVNPNNGADQVAEDLVQAFKTSTTQCAWVSIGKCEIRIDNWGKENKPQIEISWPSIGAVNPAKAHLFCLDLAKATVVATLAEGLLARKSEEPPLATGV